MTSLRILLRAWQQWNQNKDAKMGAALAYYAVFSIAPLLIFAIRIAGVVYGEDAAQGKVVEHLRDVVGAESARTIELLVENAAQPRTGLWPALIGGLMLFLGALGLFVHARDTLRTIWRLEPPLGSSFLSFLLDHLLAVLMVIFTGLLLLASLAVSTTLTVVIDAVEDRFPGDARFWQAVELGVSVVFMTLLFGAVYHVLSGHRIACGYVIYGAVICAVLFTLGKTLLGMYLARTTTASTYGAAGSLVVFLIWVYYSSQILFFGAELIQARRTRREWMEAGT